MPIVFSDSSDLQTIQEQIAAVRMMSIDGRRLCVLAEFTKPVTIVDRIKVGALQVPDGSSFDAWSMHARFADGEQVWFLARVAGGSGCLALLASTDPNAHPSD
jgi:hypothetical protein